jgi:hypothetical protein
MGNDPGGKFFNHISNLPLMAVVFETKVPSDDTLKLVKIR